MTVCGLHNMACEDFEFLKFPYMCVSSVLWCVKTLSFLNSHVCVDPMLWRVKTLHFQSSIVCESCAVACEDFSFSSSPRCDFLKFICMWRD